MKWSFSSIWAQGKPKKTSKTNKISPHTTIKAGNEKTEDEKFKAKVKRIRNHLVHEVQNVEEHDKLNDK